MRTLLFMLLVLNFGFATAQTSKSKIEVNFVYDPAFEKIELSIKSASDSLNFCKVKLLDGNKNVIKIVDLPKAATLLESSIAITDVTAGHYTCLVYKGSEGIYKGDFFKDALLMEPQIQPVFARPHISKTNK